MKTYIIIDADNNVVGISENSRIEMENYTTYEIEQKLDFSKIDGYIFQNGEVVFNQGRYDVRQLENKQWELRNKREEICFSVINRGDIWYKANVNTPEREAELNTWYQAWLDVTDTMIEPETPKWIK